MQMRPSRSSSVAPLVGLAMLLALAAPVAAAGIRGAAPAALGAVAPVDSRVAPISVAASAEAPWRTAARASVFARIAADRAASGLVGYVRDPALDDIAQARVDHLAAIDAFGHPAAGVSIIDAVLAAGVTSYAAGEAMGWASDPSTDSAIARIRSLWLGSPSHRAIVLADWASYAGIGVATEGTRTLVVLVIADTPDRTAPTASVLGTSRVGTTVTVRWAADDPRLQARTSGIGMDTVQYRVDGAGWHSVRSNGAAGVTVIPNVPADRGVDIRVRAADRAGNLSPWATARVGVTP